jgi:four helix bundle protein
LINGSQIPIMLKKNPLLDRSFEFAVGMVRLCRKLSQNKEFVISRQLLKSGTSIGANIEEAIAASSKRDFAYRMSVACRECRETRYWLRLIQATSMMDDDLRPLIDESTELIMILTKIVKTSGEEPQ